MNPDLSDVRKPLAFGFEGYLLKQVPFAAGIAALGLVLFLWVDRDRESILASYVLLAAGLGFIAYAYYRRSHPGRPVIELYPSGVRYRMASLKDVLIPWREVQDVGAVEISGIDWLRSGAGRFRDATALVVSKRFYTANIDVGSWVRRGRSWNSLFVTKGDAIQIVLHPELLSVSPGDLRLAVESRWRAFSNHPNAQRPSVPWSPRALGLFGWMPSRALKIAGLAGLAVLALPALYFWQWPLAWKSLSLSPGSRSAYLDGLLDGRGIPARLMDGRMAILGRDDVLGAAVPDCEREIVRDAERASFTPAYIPSATCTAFLTYKSGAPAIGIFKLVVVDTSFEDYSGKRHPSRALVTEPLVLREAEALLCARGYCAPGGRAETADR